MVTRQAELSSLVRNSEVRQLLLLGKFITKSQTVIEKSESDNQLSVVDGCLLQSDGKFFVMITNLFFLATHRRPSFILLRRVGLSDGEAFGERR